MLEVKCRLCYQNKGRGLIFDTGVKHIWSVNSYNNNTDVQGSNAARMRADESSPLGVFNNVTQSKRWLGMGWSSYVCRIEWLVLQQVKLVL